MRRQNKYIIGTAIACAGVAALVDLWRQYEEQKRKGNNLTWETFNGSRMFKWTALSGVSGGVIGNQIYKSKFRTECRESFSPNRFIKKILKEENIKSNPEKYKAVKTIKKEVKTTLYKTFANDLVTFPEDVGSLKKRTALNSTYDGDIVLAVNKSNSFGTLANMSATIHDTIDYLYSGTATVTKKKKATNILFDNLSTPVSIDVLYGRETSNYVEDKKLNLYARPQYFWQSGKYVKTNIGIQKDIFVNKPRVREVVKALKVYFKKNNVSIENVLIDQLVLEAMSYKNYGKDYSVTENILNCMDYISLKMNNSTIKDYANSNNNLLQKMDLSSKATVINLLDSDLKKIKSDRHYIREAFHQ